MPDKISSTKGKSVGLISRVRDYERARRAIMTPKKAKVLRSAFGMWVGRGDINDRWLEDSRLNWETGWKSR